jgi:hypothetical protein
MTKAKTCGKIDCGCNRKSRAFGAATWLAVLAAVAVVGAALWFSVKGKGAHRPSPVVATPWFPQPSFLLDHAHDLPLTIEQRRHVEVVQRAWALRKAAFEVQLKTLNSSADGALADLKSQKPLQGPYAAAVSDFDKARARAWADATKTLSANQVLVLDKLRRAGSKNAVASE